MSSTFQKRKCRSTVILISRLWAVLPSATPYALHEISFVLNRIEYLTLNWEMLVEKLWNSTAILSLIRQHASRTSSVSNVPTIISDSHDSCGSRLNWPEGIAAESQLNTMSQFTSSCDVGVAVTLLLFSCCPVFPTLQTHVQSSDVIFICALSLISTIAYEFSQVQ